jgi:hypothetical protein
MKKLYSILIMFLLFSMFTGLLPIEVHAQNTQVIAQFINATNLVDTVRFSDLYPNSNSAMSVVFIGDGSFVSEAQINMYRGGGNPGFVIVEIYAVDLYENIVGNALATSQAVDGSQLTSTSSFVPFMFDGTFKTVTGQKYSLVVRSYSGAFSTMSYPRFSIYADSSVNYNFFSSSWQITIGRSFLYILYGVAPTYTVTYAPGTHGTFAAQVTSGLHYGDATPVAPTVTGETGWDFTGWLPVPFATVTGDAIYVAQWAQTPTTTAPPVTPTPPVIVVPSGLQQLDLRFSNNERITFDNVGFGLDDKSGGNIVSVESVYDSNVDVALGFRVWLVGEGGYEWELTEGVPVAVSSFLVSDGSFSGWVSGVWDCPDVPLPMLGGYALRVVLYSAAMDGVNTVARAVFVSPVLLSDRLVGSTWTFTVFVDYMLDSWALSWSGVYGQAGVYGVMIVEPSSYDVMWFKLLGLDFFGFLLYPYVDTLGMGMFYVIVWVAVLGAYYIWHQKVSVILLIMVLLGSAGGVLFQFFPMPALLLVWTFMVVALGVLLFRLFR